MQSGADVDRVHGRVRPGRLGQEHRTVQPAADQNGERCGRLRRRPEVRCHEFAEPLGRAARVVYREWWVIPDIDRTRLMLIIFGGLPGTGKTTIARELAHRTGAVLVRVDSIEHAVRDALAVTDLRDIG